MEQVDVLIVGGGPAGLATAELAAPGGSVLLVHKDAEIGRPVRTSGGSWLSDVVRLELPTDLYHTMDSLVFAGPTRSASFEFSRNKPVVLDVTAAYKYLCTLAEKAGARIELSTKLTDVYPDNDRYICELEYKRAVRRVSARYVVDASGFQRVVLRRTDIDKKPTRYGIGAEGEFEDLSSHRNRAVLFVGSRYAPSGYGWVFPTTQGTVRVGVGLTRPDVQAAPGKLLDDFLNSAAASDLEIRTGRCVDEHGGVVPAIGPSNHVVHGGIIAVGDSAGQVLPIVGEGIRFCIEAGRKAGSALQAALREPTSARNRLNDYEQWWLRAHYRQFQLAQKINLHITDFQDEDWDSGIGRLAMLDGEMLSTLLRVDPIPWALTRYLSRHPLTALRYIGSRTSRRIARIVMGRQ